MSDTRPRRAGARQPVERGVSALGYALLGLLHEEPRSGYDLCQLFAATPMARFSSSPGAIYPALRLLEARGLIAGARERARSLRPRQVYRPTDAGLATLTEWVSRPVTRDEVVFDADVMMLRFVFMGGLVGRDVIARFLAALAEHVDAYVRELETWLPRVRAKPGGAHGALALEHGVEHHRVLASWAKQTLKRFTPPRRTTRSPRENTR
jgi:DNA-binding PadR family transcriptional regulator